jgi:regulator of nucleoside diphosphate kinase
MSSIISKNDLQRLEAILHGLSIQEAPDNPVTILRQELPRRRVLPPTAVPPAVVTMNSQVEVVDVDSNEKETWTIVYPQDADVDARKISVLTGLGVALLGAREGDVIEVRSRALSWRLRILRVIYQPEAAGRFDL